MAFFSTTWLRMFFPGVNSALQRVAHYLKPNSSTIMAYDSEKTVELLDLVLQTLRAGRTATADAIVREKAAIAALEPLRSENSRLNTALTQMEANLAALEAQDAAEDAALKAIVDFIEAPVVPPVDPTPEIPGLEAGTPSTPPSNPPADVPVVVDAEGVDPIDPAKPTDPEV